VVKVIDSYLGDSCQGLYQSLVALGFRKSTGLNFRQRSRKSPTSQVGVSETSNYKCTALRYVIFSLRAYFVGIDGAQSLLVGCIEGLLHSRELLTR